MRREQNKICHLTLLVIFCQVLVPSLAEPPVIPTQGYTAPFANGGGGGGYPSGPTIAPGAGYNSNAAAYNAALDFNSNNQIGDGGGGGYSGGHGGGGSPLTSYGTPSNEGSHGHNHEEYGEPKAYEFGYQVKDDYTGTNYNRQEKSDGNQVTGSYRVALPDGRTQIVTYYADWQTGFHADVRYEGEAHYPETYNNNRGGYNYPNSNNGGYNQPQPQPQPQPSQDYGAPSNSIHNNNYNDNTGYNNNNYNNDRYDSYSSNGFGHKVRPNQEYGAP